MFVGIDDDGVVKGLEDIKNLTQALPNIVNKCIEYGLPKPTFEYEWASVKTTFYKTVHKTAQKTPKKSTQEKILELLKENSKCTKQDLMQILGKGDGTIKEHLAKLKKEGKLQRVGGRKDGQWKVQAIK